MWLTLTPERRRFVKFCVVGASGVAVNMAFVWVGLVVFAAAGPAVQKATASALGILLSVLTNFLFNDLWTWGDRDKGHRKRDFLARMATYYVASGLATLLQFGVAQALAQAASLNIYVAQACGIAVGTLLNYAANNRWTFRDRRPPEA